MYGLFAYKFRFPLFSVIFQAILTGWFPSLVISTSGKMVVREMCLSEISSPPFRQVWAEETLFPILDYLLLFVEDKQIILHKCWQKYKILKKESLSNFPYTNHDMLLAKL